MYVHFPFTCLPYEWCMNNKCLANIKLTSLVASDDGLVWLGRALPLNIVALWLNLAAVGVLEHKSIAFHCSTPHQEASRDMHAGCHSNQTLLQLIKIPSTIKEISSVESPAEMFGHMGLVVHTWHDKTRLMVHSKVCNHTE